MPHSYLSSKCSVVSRREKEKEERKTEMVDKRGANRDNCEIGETRWEKAGRGKHEDGKLKTEVEHKRGPVGTPQ